MSDDYTDMISGETVPCPACGADDAARILYGLAAVEERLEELLKSGKVTLGGCLVYDDAPTWLCNGCGHRYGRLGPDPCRGDETWK